MAQSYNKITKDGKMKWVSIVILATALTNCLAQEKPYLSQRYDIAQPAVEVLIQKHDYDSLAEVLQRSSILEFKLRAISAIGNNKKYVSLMLLALKRENVHLLDGGTEQLLDNAELKAALMKSISENLKLQVPVDFSSGDYLKLSITSSGNLEMPVEFAIPEIATFITQAEKRMQQNTSTENLSVNRSNSTPLPKQSANLSSIATPETMPISTPLTENTSLSTPYEKSKAVPLVTEIKTASSGFTIVSVAIIVIGGILIIILMRKSKGT